MYIYICILVILIISIIIKARYEQSHSLFLRVCFVWALVVGILVGCVLWVPHLVYDRYWVCVGVLRSMSLGMFVLTALGESSTWQ